MKILKNVSEGILSKDESFHDVLDIKLKVDFFPTLIEKLHFLPVGFSLDASHQQVDVELDELDEVRRADLGRFGLCFLCSGRLLVEDAGGDGDL